MNMMIDEPDDYEHDELMIMMNLPYERTYLSQFDHVSRGPTFLLVPFSPFPTPDPRFDPI